MIDGVTFGFGIASATVAILIAWLCEIRRTRAQRRERFIRYRLGLKP